MRRANANKFNGQRSYYKEESRILPPIQSAVKTPISTNGIINDDSSTICPRNSDSLL